jgi:predicted nucleic acid-binding protein
VRVVIDTNIAFSAILNTNSIIAQIILQPKSRIHFYSTDLLSQEISEHRDKLKRIVDYDDIELDKIISLITSKIRFIDIALIPNDILIKSERLLEDIDIDDTEFVALTTHIRGKLWSGDKNLQKGLTKKGWTRFITTNDLYQLIKRKR